MVGKSKMKDWQDCVYNSALNELKNLNTDAVSKYRELLNCTQATGSRLKLVNITRR
jgi:hypothetical protein